MKTLVSLKNQVHGFLLSYGIETHKSQLQSKKDRLRILNRLNDHDFNKNAAKVVKTLLETTDL